MLVLLILLILMMILLKVLLTKVHTGNAFVLAGAGVAFLVKGVCLDVDATPTRAELVGVLGLEARELLGEVSPGEGFVAAGAGAREEHEAAHCVCVCVSFVFSLEAGGD